MSAQIFIDKLEASNLLDSEIIGKLRKKIAKPGKTPQSQAVASYCLEKGYLTESQAKRLLESVNQEVAAHQASMGQPLDVVETGPSVLSVGDLVVEEPGEAEVLGANDIVDLAAAPLAASVQPVAEIADPYGVPTQAVGLDSDAVGNSGSSELDQPAEKKTKTRFQGKKTQEQSFESRWILLGSFLIVFLCLAGWFLFTVLNKGNSDEVFNAAEAKFASESYSASVDEYKDFIKNFAGDPNVPKARVKYRVAEMKVAASGKNVEKIVEVFQSNIEEITLVLADQIDNKPFEDEIKSIISYDTVASAKKAADSAANAETVEDKEAALEKARKMMRLVNDGKFVPRASRELPATASVIEATNARLSEVENAIVQEKDTASAVATIGKQVNDGNTYDAFQTYDQLVTKHPGAGSDSRVVKAVEMISEKEQGLVMKINPSVSPFPDVSIERSPAYLNRVSIPTLTGGTVPDLVGEFGAFLVSGSVYGIELSSGKILWRHFVGYGTEIDPVLLNDPKRVLVSDEKNNRLTMIDPATGDIVWNKSVGEPFLRPTVSRNRIFLSMKSGKIARIDSESGVVSAMVQLPQRLTVPVAANSTGNVLYQAGEHLNLYVINVSLTDMNCVQALYTGHRDGSVRTAPVLLQEIVVLPVNTSPSKCELRIFMKEADSTQLKVAGETRELKGNIVKPPIRYGNFLATITSNGELEVFEMASDDDVILLATIAKKSLNLPIEQEIFIAALQAKIWIGTRGITQYDVIRSKQELKDQTVKNNADYFSGEMISFENLLVHVRKRSGSQMTSISGVNPSSLKEIWRLDIGGGLAGPPIVNNEDVMAVNSQGDFFKINDAAIAAGVNDKFTHRASKSQQNLVFNRSVDFGDGSGFFVGPSGRKDSVSFIPTNAALPVSLSEMKIDNLNLTCEPVRFRDGALVGLSNGEIRLVVPRSTEADAKFAPKANVGEEFIWQRPCVISNDTFAAVNLKGRIFTVKYQDGGGKPYMTQVLEASVGRSVIGPLVKKGNTLFTLGNGPNGNELIAIDLSSLKVKGTYPLGGISTWGPEVAGETVVVTTADGKLLGFGEDISAPTMEVKIPTGRVAGIPLSWNGKTILTLKDGEILILDLAAGGNDFKVLDSGEPISSTSSIAGNRLFVNGADGSICVFDLSKVE